MPPVTQYARDIGQVIIAGGTVSGSGNNTIVTPTSGKALRLYYVSYNNVNDCEVAFRFGATGTLWLKNNLTAKSVIAKDLKDTKWVQGAVNEPLILNLSLAVSVNWTVLYVEV